jgi:hypothetical protein
VNSGNAPPEGNGRDAARPRDSAASSAAGSSPNTSGASGGSATTGKPLQASIGSDLAKPSAGADRPEGAGSVRHRIAAGLPAQPPPLASTKAALRPNPPAGSPKATIPSLLAQGSIPGSAQGSASGSAKSDLLKPELPKPELPKPDLAIPERARSAKIGTAATPPGRVVLGAGEPEPPISGRPDGLGAPLVATPLLEPKRISPRSPRAALEPDHVPLPSRSSFRPSRRAPFSPCWCWGSSSGA